MYFVSHGRQCPHICQVVFLHQVAMWQNSDTLWQPVTDGELVWRQQNLHQLPTLDHSDMWMATTHPSPSSLLQYTQKIFIFEALFVPSNQELKCWIHWNVSSLSVGTKKLGKKWSSQVWNMNWPIEPFSIEPRSKLFHGISCESRPPLTLLTPSGGLTGLTHVSASSVSSLGNVWQSIKPINGRNFHGLIFYERSPQCGFKLEAREIFTTGDDGCRVSKAWGVITDLRWQSESFLNFLQNLLVSNHWGAIYPDKLGPNWTWRDKTC